MVLTWSLQLSAAPEALKTMDLSLGLEPMVVSLESLTWSLDLLRLRFFVSQHRRNSVRGKMIGKK